MLRQLYKEGGGWGAVEGVKVCWEAREMRGWFCREGLLLGQGVRMFGGEMDVWIICGCYVVLDVAALIAPQVIPRCVVLVLCCRLDAYSQVWLTCWMLMLL